MTTRSMPAAVHITPLPHRSSNCKRPLRFLQALQRPFSNMAKRIAGAPRLNRPVHRPFVVEDLEERQMLSAAPFVYTTLNDTGIAVGHSASQAQTLPTSPMLESVVKANDLTTSAADFFQLRLTRGEILTAWDSLTTTNNSVLTLQDAKGNKLATAVGTGKVSPDLAFRIPADGVYFLTISGGQATTPSAYTLNAQPIGLSPTLPSMKYLDTNQAALEVFLNGSTLEFTGLAGHGFGITGNWVQTVSGSGAGTTSTYKATGVTNLNTPLGQIPLPPVAGGFVVSTQPNGFGAYVGQVKSIAAGSFPLDTFANNFGAGSIFDLGLNLSLPQGSLGIAVGKDIEGLGVPVLGDVPYIYFSEQASGTLSFGGINLSLLSPLPNVQIVADPSDPYLYVGASGIPGPVSSFMFGGSVNGLIPFNPTATPQQFKGKIYGQLLWGGNVNFNAAEVPLSIKGETVYNLDANHTGKILNGLFSNASAVFSDLNNPANQATLTQALKDVSWGMNGEADMSLDSPGVSVEIPMSAGTAIYEGPSGQAFLHGNALDPFADSPLGGILNPQLTADASLNLNTLQFTANLADGFYVFGYGGAASIAVNNKSIAVSGDIRFFLGDVHVAGHVNFDGSYTLTGHANINVYLATVDALFTVAGDAQGNTTFTISAQLQALGAQATLMGQVQSNGNFTLTGQAHANFYLGNGTANFTFSDQQGQLSMFVDAGFNVLGGTSVNVAGAVNPDGSFIFLGQTTVNFYVGLAVADFQLVRSQGITTFDVSANISIFGAQANLSGAIDTSGNANLTAFGVAGFYLASGWASMTFTDISNSVSCSVAGFLSVLGASVNLSGCIDATGTGTLTGSADVNFYLGSATTTFSLTDYFGGLGLLEASAQLDALDAVFSMQGAIGASGAFAISGSAASGLLGLGNASASYSFSNSGASLDAQFYVLGQSLNVNGAVDGSGNFSFTTDVGINLAGLASGNVVYAFSELNGAFGLSALLTGGFDISIASADVLAIVSISADSNGNVQYSGSGTVSWSVGGISSSVGASISNSAINFDVAGTSFSIPLPS